MLKKWQKKMIGSSKREVNEAFGRKMNDDPQWEWKIVLGGNEQGYKHRTVCANVKDSTGGVLVNNDERKKGWREYFVEVYNVGRWEEANGKMIGFEDVINIYRDGYRTNKHANSRKCYEYTLGWEDSWDR